MHIHIHLYVHIYTYYIYEKFLQQLLPFLSWFSWFIGDQDVTCHSVCLGTSDASLCHASCTGLAHLINWLVHSSPILWHGIPENGKLGGCIFQLFPELVIFTCSLISSWHPALFSSCQFPVPDHKRVTSSLAAPIQPCFTKLPIAPSLPDPSSSLA